MDGHVRDAVIVVRDGRRAAAHRACAEHLRGQGWAVVAMERGAS